MDVHSPRRASATLAILAHLLWAACARQEAGLFEPTVDLGPVRRLFLISIDTLRADHLGCYGYPLPTSPSIDEFRRDAVLFRETIAQAPSTLPSHASILTSMIPQHHGAAFSSRRGLSPDAVTLPEILAREGFHTVAITGGGQLDPAFGLDQGFAEYRLSARNQDFDTVVRPALRWLRKHPEEKVFFFLHTFQVHDPYKPDPEVLELFDADYRGPLPQRTSHGLLEQINDGEIELDEADRRHIVHTYDAEIREMDAVFGRFVRRLREGGLYDDSVIVFTSDHGEELGEHGRMGWHSVTLYDELLRVPLLVKLPGSAFGGLEVTTQVRSLDIAPTVLAVLGIEQPAGFEGRSLLPLLERPNADPWPAVSSLDAPEAHRLWSYREGEWKLIGDGLFHLPSDPGELLDVSRDHRPVVRRLRSGLLAAVRSRQTLEGVPTEPGERAREELRALGYLK